MPGFPPCILSGHAALSLKLDLCIGAMISVLDGYCLPFWLFPYSMTIIDRERLSKYFMDFFSSKYNKFFRNS
jgi:hypothetical protein